MPAVKSTKVSSAKKSAKIDEKVQSESVSPVRVSRRSAPTAATTHKASPSPSPVPKKKKGNRSAFIIIIF